MVEIICLAYLGYRVIHVASFQHKTEFWKDKKNVMAIVLLVVSHTLLSHVLHLYLVSLWLYDHQLSVAFFQLFECFAECAECFILYA